MAFGNAVLLPSVTPSSVGEGMRGTRRRSMGLKRLAQRIYRTHRLEQRRPAVKSSAAQGTVESLSTENCEEAREELTELEMQACVVADLGGRWNVTGTLRTQTLEQRGGCAMCRDMACGFATVCARTRAPCVLSVRERRRAAERHSPSGWEHTTEVRTCGGFLWLTRLEVYDDSMSSSDTHSACRKSENEADGKVQPCSSDDSEVTADTGCNNTCARLGGRKPTSLERHGLGIGVMTHRKR